MKRHQSNSTDLPEKLTKFPLPKKLRPNSTLKFMEYAVYQKGVDFPMIYSLINEKYREKIKELENFCLPVEITLEETPNNTSSSEAPENLFAITPQTEKRRIDRLLAFLRFVECPNIELDFEHGNNFSRQNKRQASKRIISLFAYLCRGLEDLECVQKICADFLIEDEDRPEDKPEKIVCQIFIDLLLPLSKILTILTYHDILSPLLAKRKEPLEFLMICDWRFDKCTAQTFKANTRKLGFETLESDNPSVIPKLHHLKNMGPFSPNPSLQELEIPIELINAEFTDSDQDFELRSIHEEEWNEILLGYRAALKNLKNINENLTLKLGADESFDVVNTDVGIMYVGDQIERVKAIIDEAQKFGFKLKPIVLQTNIDIVEDEEKDMDKILKKFMEETGLLAEIDKSECDCPKNFIYHNGVEIQLEIKLTK